MVLHIGQLITLLAQQLSKPIVNTFSAYAKHHPQFRYAVRRLGTGWQSVEIMIERKLNGKANTVELSKNDPFDCGTKVIGEALVYLISAAILLYGYRNSTINEQAKEDNINKKIGNLQTDIESNEKEIKKQKTVIEKLRKNIVELEDKNRERRVGSCASQ